MTTRVASELPHINDEKLGEILGFVVGDGTVYKKKNRIAFSNSEMFCIKEILDNFKDVFGVEKDRFRYYLSISSKENSASTLRIWKNYLKLHRDVKVYEEKRTKKRFGYLQVMITDAHISEKIKNHIERIVSEKEENKAILLGFLRGFFAAEGAIIPGKTTREIPNAVQFPQKGRQLPEIISRILMGFGIENRVVIKQKKADYYCVNITGFENFKRVFVLHIADLHPEKRKKLENGLLSYKKVVSRKFKMPVKLLKALDKKPMTRNQIYELMNSYPQRVNGMLYSKRSCLVKGKLIIKEAAKDGVAIWKITEDGLEFLKNMRNY